MTEPWRGVFLDLDSLHPQDLDLTALRDSLPDWEFFPQTSPEQVMQRIAGARVVVTNKVRMNAAQLGNAQALGLVCVAATGTDNVDLAAARQAGIAVSNARNYATASVAEAVFAMLLTLVRQLDRYRAQVSAGHWSDSPYFCLFDAPIEELFGKMLGIVGYGVLGRAVAQRAQAFGMQVQIAQRLVGEPLDGRLPLEELLTISDVVSLHCPLSDATRNLIGPRQLELMKPSAILINTARGGIVDEPALVNALDQGWIAGAALDVLGQEPPAAGSPLVTCRSPRLVLTPHVAWASRSARQRLVGEIVENIQAFRRGERRNALE
ncbi:MAG: D-2-hydroxyacid dehydrogenase [Thiogranum sp.]|nr:D-2-hydroxyacid dehydrogenase [Thiogranum sp.]